ncbi:MAG: demethoxyubiquinone hydroxylase family protein, partial [Phenylobacterium sp.]
MSGKPIPPRPGQGAMTARLAEILRVDHAGELGAVSIYRGQRAVLGEAPGHQRIAGQLAEMEAQEAEHLARFDRLITERRVRPTALAPVWRLAGFVLGVGTALMGDRAAHACTEAVETVIEEHYAGQVAELAEREPALAAELERFRQEELAHRDLAVSEGARDAPGYALLSAMIRTGCRAAI